MIRYPALREVVRADSFTAVTRTDLAAPFFRQFGIGFLLSLVEEAGLQTRRALALFSNWDRSSWHSTTNPDGI